MRLLVIGANGQVARALVERGAHQGVVVQTAARPALDLERPESLLPVFENVSADAVVNAAAYTAVDKAEIEPDLATAINADGAGRVAAAAAAHGLPIIHLSTDYVFDGLLPRPYREDDAAHPIGIYGRSKLAGEAAVREANAAHVILRTAWVYSPFGSNFVKKMLQLSDARDEVDVVADQRGNPTSALDIADAVITIARQVKDRPSERQLRGVFHVAATGDASWADLAQTIFACAARSGRHPVTVRRIKTSQYPSLARRPPNSRLDTSKLLATYRISLPSWRTSVESCVARLTTADKLAG